MCSYNQVSRHLTCLRQSSRNEVLRSASVYSILIFCLYIIIYDHGSYLFLYLLFPTARAFFMFFKKKFLFYIFSMRIYQKKVQTLLFSLTWIIVQNYFENKCHCKHQRIFRNTAQRCILWYFITSYLIFISYYYILKE